MNHNVFEKEMIDAVNRHAEEKNTGTHDSTEVTKQKVFNKQDVMCLKRGLKSTLLATLTVIMFGFSVVGFIEVASDTGYMAVVDFIAAIILALTGFILLYAQGIIQVERQGDDK